MSEHANDPVTTAGEGDLNPFKDCESIDELLALLGGEAAVCWSNLSGAGEFIAAQAQMVTEQVTERMDKLVRAERARAWAEGAAAALNHAGLAPVDEGPVNPHLG